MDTINLPQQMAYRLRRVQPVAVANHTLLISCMSFMFCTVNGCDCQLIIKENYDDDDESR